MTSPASTYTNSNGRRPTIISAQSAFDTSVEFYENNNSNLIRLKEYTLIGKMQNKKTTKKNENSNVLIEPLLKFRVNLFDELIKIEHNYWNFRQAYKNDSTFKNKNRNIYIQAFSNLLA